MTPSEKRRERVKTGTTLPVGQPTKYKQDYPEQLITMMEQGMLDCEIYAAWNISKDTFYRWRSEKDDLNAAFEIGYPKCEAFYARHARNAMLAGDDKGFKFFIGIMNNKFGWEKGSNGDGNTTTNNITIGNMNVLQQKSREDLLTFITASLEKNKDTIDVELLEADNDQDQPE